MLWSAIGGTARFEKLCRLENYAWLSEQGFCRVHARLQLVQIADFSLWLDKRGLTIINIQPTTVDSFIEDRRRRVKPRAERSTLQRFLKLVRPEACTQVSPPLTASQVLLQDFRRHFLEERGAAQVSYLAFQPILLQFLSDCFPDGTIDCARLTAKDVIRFVRRHAYLHSPGLAKLSITALRVFLRYLRLRGNITIDLAASVRRWHCSDRTEPALGELGLEKGTSGYDLIGSEAQSAEQQQDHASHP
jgi:integrase/recombinase XerD